MEVISDIAYRCRIGRGGCIHMTAMQEHAIEMIREMSDDKIYYVVSVLGGIRGLAEKEQEFCHVI